MKRVILLAGHNFQQPGAVVNIEGKRITEFDLTTFLVTEVFKNERLMNIDLVIKQRNDFNDLPSEVNSLNADYLISCHFNAYNGKTQGSEVLYAKTSKRGARLAQMCLDKISDRLKITVRGIKPTVLGERGGFILNKTKPVAVLLEPFFMDAVKTEEELKDKIFKVSQSILDILQEIDKGSY